MQSSFRKDRNFLIIQLLVSTDVVTGATDMGFNVLVNVPQAVGCNKKAFAEQVYVVLRETCTCVSCFT
jgi:hypothetical protein